MPKMPGLPRTAPRWWLAHGPEYRARMLVDGTAAARELGFELPEHHRNLVVLENTPTVHNVIVCTLVTKHGFEHRRLAYLIVEQELERQRSLPQSKAGPRNHSIRGVSGRRRFVYPGIAN